MKLDLVDVFGARTFSGNPLGVLHGAEGLAYGSVDAQSAAWGGGRVATIAVGAELTPLG